MAKKPDVSGYERFSDVTSRLDEIVGAVRDKGTSLERSLDLFDEAIALGTRAVDLVDKAAFSAEEQELLAEGPEAAEPASAQGSGDGVADGETAGLSSQAAAAAAGTAAAADATAAADTAAAGVPDGEGPEAQAAAATDAPAADADSAAATESFN